MYQKLKSNKNISTSPLETLDLKKTMGPNKKTTI